jgi:hypothetical protein
MDEHELAALQDPANWDDQTSEVLPAADDPRVIVPVRFTPDEFALVARYARASGRHLTECIREVILDRAGQEMSASGESRRA